MPAISRATLPETQSLGRQTWTSAPAARRRPITRDCSGLTVPVSDFSSRYRTPARADQDVIRPAGLGPAGVLRVVPVDAELGAGAADVLLQVVLRHRLGEEGAPASGGRAAGHRDDSVRSRSQRARVERISPATAASRSATDAVAFCPPPVSMVIEPTFQGVRCPTVT
jgi:hypothetical protein